MMALSRAGAGAEAQVDLDDDELQDPSQSPPLPQRLFTFLPLANRRRSAGPSLLADSSVNRPAGEPFKTSSFTAEHRRVSSLASPGRAAVRFRELQDLDVAQFTAPSDDEESLVSSELSDHSHAAGSRKKRKSAPRKATRFALAYPAPQLLTKQRTLVQIRPRLLLQLQELGEKRAMPAFDVVPSTLIAGSLIIPKLSKRFPRMFRMKPHMNQNDLLLVRSEHYRLSSSSSSFSSSCSAESSGDHQDSLDDRDVLAVISTSAEQDDNHVEIVFPDGSIWATSLMANGSYEFTRTNHRGEIVKARWVKKPITGSKTTSSGPATPGAETSPEHKWTFSIIDPLTRRHPIQGVLTPTTIDIFDTYTTMSSSSSIHPPTSHFGPEASNSPDRSVIPNSTMEQRLRMEVTEDDKKLMLATAIWISLRQKGWPWSAAPKLAKAMMSSCTSSATPGSTAAAAAAAARSQPPSPTYASLDAAAPLISSADTFAPLASTPPSAKQKSVRRAVSSGSEHTRKRRDVPELSGLEEAEEEGKPKHKAQVGGGDAGAPTTCRSKFKRFTHKLFHPKSQLVL